jgi:hypothetical protein
MKSTILLLSIFLLCREVSAQSNEVPGGIFNPTGRTLSVKVRPTASFNSAGRNLLTNIVATIRWPISLGVTLSAPVSPVYGVAFADSGIAGGYKYIIYAAADNTLLNWTANNEYELFTVDVSGTPAGTFELTNAVINGEWYVEINGIDRTNPIFYQGSAAVSPAPVISASAGANGSISPSGTVSVNYGGTQTFLVAPSTGFHVDSLLVDNVKVDSTTSYTFLNVTADHSIRAVFRINQYTIAASAGPNGTISPPGLVTLNYGASQAFTISPATGYHVDSLLVDGVKVDSSSSYTFGAVSANHTIRAVFAINQYTIAAISGAYGSIEPSGSISVIYGSTQRFAVSPASGYHTDSLIVDGVRVDSMAGYTFYGITGNHSIRVTFRINQYTIVATAGSNGSITPSGDVAIDHGSGQMFVVTPASGYHVDSLLVDGSPVDSSSSYTFVNVTASHTIRAVFRINIYSIAASAGPGGIISPAGIVTVNHGTDQTFSVAPATGYHVDSLLVDNSIVDSTLSYTFRNITGNHSIRAVFALNQYLIISSAGPHGTITPSGNVFLNHGGDQHFVIAPAIGYHVDSVFVDGNPVDSVTGFTFRDVTSDHSIRAVFGINHYTISAAAGPNGTITPSGPVIVDYETAQVFSFTPASGYRIDSVLVDGVAVDSLEHYTFVAVSANHSIRVSFRLDQIPVSVNHIPGWNMISCPVTVSNDSVHALLPGAMFPYAFAFSGSYAQSYRLEAGKGYWEKFSSAGTHTLTGLPRALDTIHVVAGWNMVGTISASVDTASIVSVPSGLRSSTWYGYTGAYQPVAQLIPGLAYWVKAGGVGTFLLSLPLAGRPEKEVMVENGVNRLNALSIVDGKGRTQTLYFGPDGRSSLQLSLYEMPPLPPAGSFDARFATSTGGSMVALHASDRSTSLPVDVQTDDWPITIRWNITDAELNYELLDGVGGTHPASIPMNGNGEVRLTSPAGKISVHSLGSNDAPVAFALRQNYPNPFNPSTTIAYDLPREVHVRLRVFDLLGREVATLVNETRKAGHQAIPWNPGGAASGVYYYRLEAGDFVASGKMLLLR